MSEILQNCNILIRVATFGPDFLGHSQKTRFKKHKIIINIILYIKVINMFRRCCNKKRCGNCKRCNCCNRGMDKFDITMEQLKQMQSQGAIVCDIRSPQEYKEGHLPGAILLPEYEIYRSAVKILPNKNQAIIVYCGTGSRSYTSLRKLQKLGYSNVYNLYKGTENY